MLTELKQEKNQILMVLKRQNGTPMGPVLWFLQKQIKALKKYQKDFNVKVCVCISSKDKEEMNEKELKRIEKTLYENGFEFSWDFTGHYTDYYCYVLKEKDLKEKEEVTSNADGGNDNKLQTR